MADTKRHYFGTDGVRHKANRGPLTAQKILQLAIAVGRHFGVKSDAPQIAVIGRDTRLSGDMIEAALVAGLTSVGVDVVLAGVIPTPAVALAARDTDASFGIMITASHNQFEDNGIKFFSAQGTKLSDDDEIAIERLMAMDATDALSDPSEMGAVTASDDAAQNYIKIAASSFPQGLDLSGHKIVLDCANGAAFQTAPAIFATLGAAEIITIGNAPNGRNINKDCGSTRTDLLSKTVIETGAQMGVALDGDADRLIMCDETGTIIDGDQLLGLMGRGFKDRGLLSGGGVVATVMSNLGLERFLESEGLSLIRTQVGDRYVSATMREDGYNVGGEQSGHLLLTDFSPAGDGTMAALQVMAVIVRANKAASDVLRVFEPVPQLLKNVRYSGSSPLEKASVIAALDEAKADMGTGGRILVRASGTEPVIRVMAEGDDPAQVTRVVDTLADVIANA